MNKKLQIKIKYLDEEKCIFTLENSLISTANALRRVIISEVPTMAIYLVEIESNSTCLHDEFISHRLGLIPITSEKIKSINYSEECPKCDGWCPECSVTMKIKVRQLQDKTRIVTTKDIESENKDFVPVDNNSSNDNGAVIVKINKGQELKVTCIGKKGVGKMHSKWCPVAVCTFHYIPDIKLNPELMNDMKDKEKRDFVDSCPSKVYSLSEDPTTGKKTIEIEDENIVECTYCKECIKKAEELKLDGLVSVRQKRGEKKGTYNFLFTVESTGVLPPERIVLDALEILENKMENVKKKLNSLIVDWE